MNGIGGATHVGVVLVVGGLSLKSAKWIGGLVSRAQFVSCARHKAMSVVSSTDFAVWQNLANAEIVDVDVELGQVRGGGKERSARDSALRRSVAEAAKKESDDDKSDKGEEAAKAPPPPSIVFRKAVEAAAAPAPPAPSPPPRPLISLNRADGGKKADSGEAKEDNASNDDSDESAPSPRHKCEDKDSERREKQGFLIELSNLEKRGVLLTRKFTMSDSLVDIQFEFDRQTSNLSTLNTVSFMRDSLKLAITGIELANNRLGPVLSIEGWANSVTEDMSRYDHCLERLYKRYWRKTTMSPIVELGFLILGSAMTYHFKMKFFGPQGVSRPEVQPRAAEPPKQRGAAVRPARPATRRPTLRPPSLYA